MGFFRSVKEWLKRGWERLTNRGSQRANKNKTGDVIPTIESKRINYDVVEKQTGTSYGGAIGVMDMAIKLGLMEKINEKVKVLKNNKPYLESDHIFAILLNILTGGTRISHIERLRHDEGLLKSFTEYNLPSESAIGDFLRRFDQATIDALFTAINEIRINVWKQLPSEVLKDIRIDLDGVFKGVNSNCKEKIAYNGHKKDWGFHPLVVSLANTGEVLYVVNRAGNAASNEGNAIYANKAIDLVNSLKSSKIKSITLRGDTDFSNCKHLDDWHEPGVKFVFGFDAKPNLIKIAENISEKKWLKLYRGKNVENEESKRTKQENVKRLFQEEKNWNFEVLIREYVSSVRYTPEDCSYSYRMVILKKIYQKMEGKKVVGEKVEYFFYITNKEKIHPKYIVFEANDRCNSENTYAEGNSIGAFNFPSIGFLANATWMMIVFLASSLKIWYSFLITNKSKRKKIRTMEFKTFVREYVTIPASVAFKNGKVIVRIMCFKPELEAFLAAHEKIYA